MTEARILVADDEGSQRELLAGFLRRAGYEVEEAADGVEAVERTRRGSVDMVLLDQRMPRMGGVDALRAIRDSNPDVDVVMMTAYGSVESAVEVLSSVRWTT